MEPLKTKNVTESERGSVSVSTATVVGMTALAALAFAPRGDDAPKPAPQPETYTDMAQESAQQAYDPTKDELLIDGIRIKPRDSGRNSPSEAVLSHLKVQEFIADNPDEAAAIESSAMALPSNVTGEYVVAGDDIDGDGDLDAVAKSKE